MAKCSSKTLGRGLLRLPGWFLFETDVGFFVMIIGGFLLCIAGFYFITFELGRVLFEIEFLRGLFNLTGVHAPAWWIWNATVEQRTTLCTLGFVALAAPAAGLGVVGLVVAKACELGQVQPIENLQIRRSDQGTFVAYLIDDHEAENIEEPKALS